jgi:hypothetical protein
MLIRIITSLMIGCIAGSSAFSQEKTAAVQIRAVLHDPVHPVADLYIADPSGAIVKLNLLAEGFSRAQFTLPQNGSIVLFDKANVDPTKPAESIAATCAIPSDAKRLMMLIFPAPANAKPAYRAILINEDPAVFANGQSRVINLTSTETALEMGEHKLPLRPGKITDVPVVKKVNEYNMAQTNFYYKEGETWMPFTERQLQYLDSIRRVFLIYVTTGSTQPFVTTIVDNAPAIMPNP